MIAQGPENAPLEVVVFADFKCPGCKAFRPVLKKTLERFPQEQYRLIYKLFPMERECNPLVEKLNIEGHPGSCELAAMGQALHKLGKFWEFAGDMYEVNERSLYESLKAIAQKAGIPYLDWVRLAKENPADNPIMKQVGSDIYEGVAIRFAELPALFINGRFVNTQKPDSIEAIMKFELDRVAKGESAAPKGEATADSAPPKPEASPAAAAPGADPAPIATKPPATPAPTPNRTPRNDGVPSTLDP